MMVDNANKADQQQQQQPHSYGIKVCISNKNKLAHRGLFIETMPFGFTGDEVGAFLLMQLSRDAATKQTEIAPQCSNNNNNDDEFRKLLNDSETGHWRGEAVEVAEAPKLNRKMRRELESNRRNILPQREFRVSRAPARFTHRENKE